MKNNIVYAFEPTPELVERNLKPREKANYIVVPKAVSNTCGIVDFYVAGTNNWGCSSIHKFSEGLNESWPGRQDFKVTHVHKVECITMEKFLDENPHIQNIDHLHCDTQGNDLNVLIGFGKHIRKIVKGMIEVYARNPLYKDTNNSMENAISFLEQNGFKVTNKQADIFNNEVNLHFERI
jgi:FkbM family methyltransferase